MVSVNTPFESFINEKMVLGMPSENWQCQSRRNMGGQLIPDTRCSG